ncbi:MAG: hypothetical protein ACREQL_15765 [Candidatus Binatia bacterium]
MAAFLMLSDKGGALWGTGTADRVDYFTYIRPTVFANVKMGCAEYRLRSFTA